MSRSPFRLAFAAALLAAVMSAAAQPAPASSGADASAQASQPASQQELDSLLAPIALYPDALVAQILMASTYPLEVVLASRWSKEHAEATGTVLEDAMQKQDWDPAVKALTTVPQVLTRMGDNLAWVEKLGDAFLADPDAVRNTIQALRAKAFAAGNLKSTPEQIVRTEVVDSQTIYIIEPAQPDVLYVPTYDPYSAYGDWWWPYPPYSMYPPGYYYPPGLAFAVGIIIGAAIWGNCNWGGGGDFVTVNPLKYDKFNRTNTGDRNWRHNVDHRRGVAYGDNRVAQRYQRGSDAQSVQSREQYRARAEPSQRPARDSGFSGADRGSSSRDASTRGGASRGSMGGARMGGGRGGGRR